MITAAQIAKVMQLTGDFSEPLGVAFGGKAMEDDGRLTADVGDLAPNCLSLLAPRESGQSATVAFVVSCGMMLTSATFDAVPVTLVVPASEVVARVLEIQAAQAEREASPSGIITLPKSNLVQVTYEELPVV